MNKNVDSKDRVVVTSFCMFINTALPSDFGLGTKAFLRYENSFRLHLSAWDCGFPYFHKVSNHNLST